MSEVQDVQFNEVEGQQEAQSQVQPTIISLLKLSTGDEVLSEVVVEQFENGNRIIHLVNPCTVEREFLDDGQVTAKFQPMAVLYEGETVQLSDTHIVWTGRPTADFEKVYLQRFSKAPQILTPPEKKIVLPGDPI